MAIENNLNLSSLNEKTFCELLAQCEIRELASRIGNAVVDFFTYIIVKTAEGINWTCKTIFCCLSGSEDFIDPSLLESILPVAQPPSSIIGIDMKEVSLSEEAIETERKVRISQIKASLSQTQVEDIYRKISANGNNQYKCLSAAQISGDEAFSQAEQDMINMTLGDYQYTYLTKLSEVNTKYGIQSTVCLDKTLENEAESTANLEIAQKYCAYGAKYLTHAIESLEPRKKIILENLIRESDCSMYEEVAALVVRHAIKHPDIQLPRYFNQMLEKKPLSKCIENLRREYDEKLYNAVVFTLIQANPAFAASMQILIAGIENTPIVPEPPETPLI